MHWSRDDLCQKAVHAVLWARSYLNKLYDYHWLHSMLEDAIFNRKKFTPNEYSIDSISDISSIDYTPFEEDKNDNNSISEPYNEPTTSNDVLNVGLPDNYISDNGLYDQWSNQKVDALDSIFTMPEQENPRPTCSSDSNNKSPAWAPTLTYSLESDSSKSTEPSRQSHGDGHFLSVRSALSQSRGIEERNDDYITECASNVFMEKFMKSNCKLIKSVANVPPLINVLAKASSSSLTDDKRSFVKNMLEPVKECDEEKETGSINLKNFV